MTKKRIAKAAAVAAYNAVISSKSNNMIGSRRKIAGNRAVFTSAPNTKELAKAAARATYEAILKAAQELTKVPVDYGNIRVAMRSTAPNFSNYIESGDYVESQQVPYDVNNFVQYVKSGGKGEGWAKPENWPAVVDAVVSNVTTEYKDGLRQYLLSL